MSDRLLYADMECLKRIKNTVLIASGRQKVEAIQVAYGQLLTYKYNQEEVTAPSGQEVQMAFFHIGNCYILFL